MKITLTCSLAMAWLGLVSASTSKDATAAVLNHCLSATANASTAGQTDCEAAAEHAYDRRMNVAFATLVQKLPAAAAERLRKSQRGWLAFRDSENTARTALYESRQGTMYVPMEASDTTNVIRDRALQLEAYVRVLSIE
ncbi:lysozyme inhibitor LprI family protein [Sphingomonas sp. PAMC 26605]|uniref:lysozyme inhibitor LprI family protein n=1 Tax=Sphingomonas sp. PAMC 26605 TaxID=1112214 RepID=UPI0012F51BC2|nr:lysozyme inhibitor LprI family protein [Sphingomonas sp. PAMC 26605]